MINLLCSHVAVENVRRRSIITSWNSAILDLKRSRKCRRMIRRSQEQAIQWLRERSKPRSRQKRFKRTKVDSDRLSEKGKQFQKCWTGFIGTLKAFITLQPNHKTMFPCERSSGRLRWNSTAFLFQCFDDIWRVVG